MLYGVSPVSEGVSLGGQQGVYAADSQISTANYSSVFGDKRDTYKYIQTSRQLLAFRLFKNGCIMKGKFTQYCFC